MTDSIYGDGDANFGTMVKLGETVAMRWPAQDLRGAYIVGEHRMVKAWKDGEDETADWMCFDHGWDCWMTRLAANGAPFELDFCKPIDSHPHPEEMEPDDERR